GLPLAIELAAARTTVLAPEQLLARLKDRFQVLVGARGARARHATLRATIDWSWALLAPWEQAALAQASVFVGGFTLPAAEQVLDLAAWPEAPPVLDVVQALVDKSLLRTWMPGGGARLAIDEPYFGMYVSIHEYAQAKLRADEALPAGADGMPRTGATAARHGRYFAGFGTEAAVDALDTHGGVARRRALGLELENLVAACRRAQGRGDALTAVATFAAASGVLGLRGPFDLAVTLGRPILALAALAPADRARAMVLLADALRLAGQMDEALRGYQDAIGLARAHGQRRLEGIALVHLGLVHTDQGRMDEAMQHVQDALAIHREVGNRRFECVAEISLGGLCWYQGRMEASLAHNQAALVIAREVGDRSSEGVVLSHLGMLHSVQGRLQEALRDYRDALATLREVGDRRSECSVLNNLGFADRGRLPGARQHYEDALAISREVGYRRIEAIVLDNLGDLHMAQGRPDEAMRHYQDAIAIARELGDRRSEGLFTGSLGLLHARQGRFEPAREALATGAALLRAVNDRWQLGILLCRRGECEHLAGNPAGAGDDLAEAEGLAQDLAAGPDAEISQAIGKLRALLAGASPAPGI
ncbi:MAG: ATP-binding protein, partial [Aquabacterium sp.]